jgi:hypothetical protein
VVKAAAPRSTGETTNDNRGQDPGKIAADPSEKRENAPRVRVHRDSPNGRTHAGHPRNPRHLRRRRWDHRRGQRWGLRFGVGMKCGGGWWCSRATPSDTERQPAAIEAGCAAEERRGRERPRRRERGTRWPRWTRARRKGTDNDGSPETSGVEATDLARRAPEIAPGTAGRSATPRSGRRDAA